LISLRACQVKHREDVPVPENSNCFQLIIDCELKKCKI
jgi:hypothetical protein